jgi:hypothetical protein
MSSSKFRTFARICPTAEAISRRNHANTAREPDRFSSESESDQSDGQSDRFRSHSDADNSDNVTSGPECLSRRKQNRGSNNRERSSRGRNYNRQIRGKRESASNYYSGSYSGNGNPAEAEAKIEVSGCAGRKILAIDVPVGREGNIGVPINHMMYRLGERVIILMYRLGERAKNGIHQWENKVRILITLILREIEFLIVLESASNFKLNSSERHH